MTKAKRCNICGFIPSIVKITPPGHFVVFCNLRLGEYATREKAVRAWNRSKYAISSKKKSRKP